jgi:UDP-GlcNAc:undecaprenyl-phosphate/decaprenyl-phosphate GlcNAc-1-phosphate transferase
VATAAHLSASFVLAFATALAATPLAIRLAKRTAFYDHPEGYKAHLAATPYLGGAAVLSAFAVGALVVAGGHGEVGFILVGAVGLWAVGTVDDRRTLRPAYRLIAAALAAALLWANGLGWDVFPAEGANLAVTVLWVVGLVNAFNLMDNMDGAASAVAATSAAGTAVLALMEGAPHLAGLGLALSGACLGFLRYNLASPARIFLGDGGSMPVGFVLAAMTMAIWPNASFDLPSLVPALLVVGVATFDTALVVVSRYRRRVPIYKGARDHVTHRLRPVLGTARAVALALAVLQGSLCVLAVTVAIGGPGDALVVATVCLGVGIMCGLLLEVGPLALYPEAAAATRTVRPLQRSDQRSSGPAGAYVLVADSARALPRTALFRRAAGSK